MTHGRKMDRERQTFELLQLLGDDVAEAVLSRLAPERAALIRTGMQSEVTRRSTIGRQRAVLDEFDSFFQYALKSQPGSNGPTKSTRNASQGVDLKQKSPREPGDESASGESDSAGGAIEYNDLDDVAAAEVAPKPVQKRVRPPVLTGIPLLDLQVLSAHQIAAALASEQPKTCAILLNRLPAKLAGDVLSLMKSEHQKLVMKELTREQHAPDVLVERIAKATFSRARQLPADPPDTREHADRVAEVLRSVPKAARREMLAVIEEQDPDLAKALLTKIYRFDDIAGLGKTLVQRVLGEIDSANLTTALMGAPTEVTDAVFSNLSKRARQTIEEEMQFMTNVTQARVQQARETIAEVIAKIDMESE